MAVCMVGVADGWHSAKFDTLAVHITSKLTGTPTSAAKLSPHAKVSDQNEALRLGACGHGNLGLGSRPSWVHRLARCLKVYIEASEAQIASLRRGSGGEIGRIGEECPHQGVLGAGIAYWSCKSSVKNVTWGWLHPVK